MLQFSETRRVFIHIRTVGHVVADKNVGDAVEQSQVGARLEGQVAFPALLKQFMSIETVGPEPEWINSLVFRGMKALPVRVRR